MQTISRYIMTLALLLTAVTGAWAQSYEAKVFDVPASWAQDETNLSAADLPKDFVQITKDEAKALAVPDGSVVLIYGFVGENVLMMAFENGTAIPDDDDDGAPEVRAMFIVFQTMAKVCYTAPGGPKVAWDASTKTGTFTMPGGNVTLEPEYYPQAALTAAPTAINDVPATTDGAVVEAGTVANIGSTTTAQGTVMYYVSTTEMTDAALLALAADAWKADVPTAESLAAGQAFIYYYVRGNDSDTDEENFSDGDILAANALTVTIAAEPTYAVTLSDEDNDLSALDNYKGQEIYVNYTRSFTAGTASTVCLPFAYTKKAADGSFYAFTNIEKEGNDYVATMTEPGLSTLEANTPYLYMPNATGDFSFSGTYTIPAELTAGSTTSGDWTFQGTYETIEWTTAPTGIYGFSGQAVDGISQGQFVKVGAYVRIAPMRCYLENASFAGARSENGTNDEVLPETIKVRLISANGTVTAIGSLSTKTGEVTLDSDAWYSLDGRRVVTPAKGVYIKNGRKVVFK